MRAYPTCIVVPIYMTKALRLPVAVVGQYGTCVLDCRSRVAVWPNRALGTAAAGNTLVSPFVWGQAVFMWDRKYASAN